MMDNYQRIIIYLKLYYNILKIMPIALRMVKLSTQQLPNRQAAKTG